MSSLLDLLKLNRVWVINTQVSLLIKGALSALGAISACAFATSAISAWGLIDQQAGSSQLQFWL